MMAGVTQEDFKDLEARPHMAQFLLGKSYYSDDSFGLAADHFEVAVDEYFTADKECRALCEGTYNYDGYNYMEYSADLFQTMTDHYMQVLNCKQNCAVELASTAGKLKPFEDFLAAHFNYLQFSYYNSEKYEKAIECAMTFLLFNPEDTVMKQNLAYYSAVFGDDKAETISARQVVKLYMQQSILEKELLYFGYEAFGIAFVDPDTWTPAEVMPKKLRDKQKAEKETAARITEEIGNLMKEIETMVEEKKKDTSEMAIIIPPHEVGAPLFDNVKVTMTSQQLNGSERVLLDGVISEDECRELHSLSNLGQEGAVPLKSARLFFDVSERVKMTLESYFGLDAPLYFSYSHLVCRSAIAEKQEEREDLSHAVHVDNCLLVSELNECVKEPPAYTHRDFSAILYLNGDFEGGDFIFTELDAKTVTAEVRPQCGRVVGFGAGKENPHGVRAVTKGQRCAVALWFTLDPAHQEKERIQAEEMLRMFSTPVNAEFMQKEVSEPPEPQQATPAPAAQFSADQGFVETKSDDKPAEKGPDAAADSETNKTETKPVKTKTDTKAKAAPKAKAKAGDKAKTKTASKPAAKKDGKQVKTQAKPAVKKDAKPAAKKTVKAAAKKDSEKDSESDKQEL
ncbi:hypothetical protein F7725_016509 [Dissostichus mawsoni]|uniref:procollagen-proline 3-dioxygenase n=1 Tax=Dissostichus mawsoni TaxID=36200 RepID=A0A7J5Z2H2_DISMA|nr:hypothetical protein F7725_016509 [Dissostichus mawsoni]